MTARFEAREVAISAIVAGFRSAYGDHEWLTELAQQIADKCRIMEFPDMPPGTMGLLAPKIRWVIRDDDLNAFDAFVKGAIPATVAYLAQASAASTFIVATLSSAFTLARAIRRKGAKLTEDECQLLLALQMFNTPIGVAELEAFLRARDSGWSADKVTGTLKSLEKLRVGDGATIAVVA